MGSLYVYIAMVTILVSLTEQKILKMPDQRAKVLNELQDDMQDLKDLLQEIKPEQNDESKVCKQRGTKEGACCTFPFIYRGKTYNDCTTINNWDKLWCATTTDYDKDKKWGNCDCKRKTEEGACCTFPFYYNGKRYDECTTKNNKNQLWCSTTSVYVWKWGNCEKEIQATCALTGSTSGVLTLKGTSTGTRITGTVSNLRPGKHAFHIHEKGDLSDGCASTGGHFNPFGTDHGSHVGDVGNIDADAGGVGHVDMSRADIHLSGESSVMGRSLVIHEGQDPLSIGADADAVLVPNAKNKVDCCVITSSN